MCVPLRTEGAPSRGVRSPDCQEMTGRFYVKNKCGGILTISSKNEFILQKSGLNIGHPSGKNEKV